MAPVTTLGTRQAQEGVSICVDIAMAQLTLQLIKCLQARHGAVIHTKGETSTCQVGLEMAGEVYDS